MPNFDKTGPRGEGSRTGRGMGNCSGKSISFNQGGRGNGRGLGRGFGLRGFFSRRGDYSRKAEDLKSYQEDLKAELKSVEDELKNHK